MLIIFCSLLMLRVGQCKDDFIFQTKTVTLGEDVTLTCSRLTSEYGTMLYWIRLVSGNWPEFLGSTFSFDYNGVNKTPHITTKQQPGTFILQISKTTRSDSGIYYCVKVKQLDMTFIMGEILIIKETKPTITAVIQEPPSNLVHSGDPVTLQCSVLFKLEKSTCENHSVYWFRAGSDQSHPSFIYTQRNSGDECEKSPKDDFAQKCIYNFTKIIRSSDSGTYYCAVVACGQILFGNGTKLDTEAVATWNVQKTIILLLSASLSASVVVMSVLTYNIKKKSCNCFKEVTPGGDQQGEQRQEVSLVYSAPTFTRRKTQRTETTNAETSEAIYTTVSALEDE